MFDLRKLVNKNTFWLVLIIGSLSFILCKKYTNKISRQFYYNNLYHSICSENDSDSLKIIKCFKYISNQIKPSGHFIKTKGLDPVEIIEKGYGSCDQQANLLITILEKGDFPGKLVFLYDDDSISLHSVCEIKMGNRLIMLDPFYEVLFYNNDNMMASLSDISSGNINNPTYPTLPNNYLNLFNNDYPKKIFRTNNTKKIHQSFNKIIFYLNVISKEIRTFLKFLNI